MPGLMLNILRVLSHFILIIIKVGSIIISTLKIRNLRHREFRVLKIQGSLTAEPTSELLCGVVSQRHAN